MGFRQECLKEGGGGGKRGGGSGVPHPGEKKTGIFFTFSLSTKGDIPPCGAERGGLAPQPPLAETLY